MLGMGIGSWAFSACELILNSFVLLLDWDYKKLTIPWMNKIKYANPETLWLFQKQIHCQSALGSKALLITQRSQRLCIQFLQSHFVHQKSDGTCWKCFQHSFEATTTSESRGLIVLYQFWGLESLIKTYVWWNSVSFHINRLGPMMHQFFLDGVKRVT